MCTAKIEKLGINKIKETIQMVHIKKLYNACFDVHGFAFTVEEGDRESNDKFHVRKG